MRFVVHAHSGASSSAVEAVVGGELVVSVAVRAALVNAVNGALVRLLADDLGLTAASVKIVAGGMGRRKVVVVSGITPEAALARWPDLTLL